jgi:NAD(P)-dependent dehydrogenase (short-subunit alcohol dehydrogenase family)
MTDARGSAIGNIVSVNGVHFYSHPTCSATRASLLSLAGSLIDLFGYTGLRFNAGAPGTVFNPMWRTDEADIAEKTGPLAPYVPLGKFAQPDEGHPPDGASRQAERSAFDPWTTSSVSDDWARRPRDQSASARAVEV